MQNTNNVKSPGKDTRITMKDDGTNKPKDSQNGDQSALLLNDENREHSVSFRDRNSIIADPKIVKLEIKTVTGITEDEDDDRGESDEEKEEPMALYKDDYSIMTSISGYLRAMTYQTTTAGKRRAPKLNGIIGVYLPTLQHIFGVIMFLRLYWIIGNAGFLQGFFMVFICCLCTFITSISMSAIATNGKVESGGSYFMISRNLGPQFGTAVGLLFYLGNAVATAMYLVGTIEILLTYVAPNLPQFRSAPGAHHDDHSAMFNNFRTYASGLLFTVFVIVALGVKFVQLFAPITLACVLISILCVFLGGFVKSPERSEMVCYLGERLLTKSFWVINNTLSCNKTILENYYCAGNQTEFCDSYFKDNIIQYLPAMPGFASGIIKKNIWPVYMNEGEVMPGIKGVGGRDVTRDMLTNFFVLLAIYFPSVTGIMTGSNMSGDLKDPQKDIPRYTIGAQLTTSFVYLSFVCIFAGTTRREVLLDKYGVSMGGGMIVAEICWPHRWVLLIGSLTSTFGAGLQCLCSAPRLLQSISKDDVIPFLKIFTPITRFGEPFRALLISYFFAECAILLGNVDLIAPLVDIFFLMLYAFVNVVCALQKILNTPNWRPRFKYYHWFLSLIGAALSLFIMFATYWYYALFTVILCFAIYKYVEYRGAEKEWGDGIRGLKLAGAKYSLLNIEENVHTKNWRPQILILCKTDADLNIKYPRLISFAGQMKGGRGLVILASLIEGDYADKEIRDKALKVKELKETLDDPDSCIYEDRIESELLESVTNSVRRLSKKSRDAAKLSHIVKKNHFKAFFKCMKELSNEEHIPLDYFGPLEEIIIEEDLYDGNESESHSVMTENSYESDVMEDNSVDNSVDNSNLPPYQITGYNNINPQIRPNQNRYNNNSSVLSPNQNGRFGDNKGFSIDSDFQIISIQRDGRPLGITVIKASIFHAGKQVNGCAIERILVNSLIDKQGLLQVGDIILEVNDEPVETPEDIRDLLERYNGTLTFKTIKSQKRPASNFVNREKVFVRALFDFNPHEYSLLPAEEIGLPFKAGDVFEVLNRDDDNFWQALPLNSTDNQAYLIPSQSLQERLITATKALNAKQDENTYSKGKRKKSKKVEIFRAKDAADLGSEVDLQTYEDVVRFGPSRVPLLILIGPTGIGKKAIKHLLVTMEPHRFSFPIMDTSLPKKGRNQPLMNHIDKNAMLNDINLSRYVCVEEKSGELYGIKLSLMKDLIKQGKTVVLDCQPKDVYSLKMPAFNPYVVLIAAPQLYLLEAMQKDGLEKNLSKNKRSTSELQNIIDQSDSFKERYKHLINQIIVNSNVHETASIISTILSEFENNPSWIPASWELDITPLSISKPAANKRNLKLNDNSNAPSSLPRRYEKRNEKPSVSSNPNKVVLNNSTENSYSEQESESDSENNVVKAIPVKYSNSKKSEDNIIKVEEKPVKHSNSKKIDDPKLKVEEKSPKNSVSKVPEDKTDGKSKKPSISRKPENTKLQADEKPIKPTITKKSEEKTPKIEEAYIKHKTSKKTEETPTAVKDKPIETSQVNVHINKKSSVTVGGQKPNQMQSRNTKEPEITGKPRIDVQGANNKNKTLEIKQEESIRNNNRSMPPQKLAAAGRMNIVRKENSSSEISDTSSDSEAMMKENRV